MYNLTAADFADTGQWRMILKIRKDGLEACLENTLRDEVPPQKLCSSSWEVKSGSLLSNLEEAVYENPRLLDDFATKIILFDAHTLFAPREIIEAETGSESIIYNKVYKASAKDIMSESWKDVTALWTMAPGIREFLLRTFPGARLSCNLLEKFREQCRQSGQWLLKAELRKDEVDIVLTEGEELRAAATSPCDGKENMEQKIEKVLKAYGRSADDTAVELVIDCEE